jgi:O-succinylbenzoic acid--CoA ligase
MTETASQIATAALSSLDAKPDFPDLQILSHLDVATPDSKIRVRGNSLLTGYIHVDEHSQLVFTNPKDEHGWLTTEDFGEVQSNHLKIFGRASERIKIGGELVNLARLREILTHAATTHGIQNKVALIAVPDARLESIIALCIEPGINSTHLQEEFDGQVMPYERIRAVTKVKEIPRTELGKIKYSQLAELAQEP